MAKKASSCSSLLPPPSRGAQCFREFSLEFTTHYIQSVLTSERLTPIDTPCTYLLSPLTYPCVYTTNIIHLPAAFLVSTLFPLYTLFISIEWNFFLSPLFWLLPGSEDIMATRRHKYAVSNTTATVPNCKLRKRKYISSTKYERYCVGFTFYQPIKYYKNSLIHLACKWSAGNVNSLRPLTLYHRMLQSSHGASGSYKHGGVGYRTASTVLMFVTPRGPWCYPTVTLTASSWGQTTCCRLYFG